MCGVSYISHETLGLFCPPPPPFICLPHMAEHFEGVPVASFLYGLLCFAPLQSALALWPVHECPQGSYCALTTPLPGSSAAVSFLPGSQGIRHECFLLSLIPSSWSGACSLPVPSASVFFQIACSRYQFASCLSTEWLASIFLSNHKLHYVIYFELFPVDHP